MINIDIPEFRPMKNLPIISISYERDISENPIKADATKTNTLLISKPPLRPNFSATYAVIKAPIIPPTQKMDTTIEYIKSTVVDSGHSWNRSKYVSLINSATNFCGALTTPVL